MLGIDCGAQEYYVAAPPQSVEPGAPAVRCFSAFTQGLDASVEWLKACGVTTAAIESTAAQSVGRTDTALGIFYRRKKAHLGPAKATTATARKLACLVYHLLKYKDQYREPDPATYQLKVEKAILARIQKQAALLGYKLLPTTLVPA